MIQRQSCMFVCPVGGAICEMFRQYEAAYQVYGTSQSADINNYVQFDLEKGAKWVYLL